MVPTLEDRYVGALLGAAIGDALGWAAERRPESGLPPDRGPLKHLTVQGSRGLAGAATQQMLFVAEGVMRAHNRVASGQPADPVASVHRSLLRWLETQRATAPPPRADGWLAGHVPMYRRRTVSLVSTHALRSGLMGRVQQPINNSREAAPLATVVPAALVSGWEPFDLGRKLAAITHGHPDVGLAAAAFAHLLQQLVLGNPLADAVESTWVELEGDPEGPGLLAAMDAALDAGDLGDPSPERLAPFGDGRDAQSALAIAVYCASVTDSFDVGVATAVRHDGATAWTGPMAGALLGAVASAPRIPQALRDELELLDVVEVVARDLHLHFARSDFEPNEEDWNRYPG